MTVTFPDRLELAWRDTPIQPLPALSEALGKSIRVWRDDLTGWALSGNKIRKLEFLCAEARAVGANHLVTCGGPQSNHARATAFAARNLGWDITIVVREPPGGFDHADMPNGNLLLNRILGANLVFIPFDEYQEQGSVYEPFLEATANRLYQQGARPFMVPEGGSCAMGCWGYLAAVREKRRDTKNNHRAQRERNHQLHQPKTLVFVGGSEMSKRIHRDHALPHRNIPKHHATIGFITHLLGTTFQRRL